MSNSSQLITPGEGSQVAEEVPRPSEDVQPQKKRRLRGACDICRRQKVRCDSAKMPGNRCTNCLAFNSECKHTRSQHKEEKGPRRKRGTNPQPQPQPVDEEDDSARVLETAKNVVDGLLRQTSTFQAPEDHEALFQLLLQVARYARSLEHELDMFHRSPPDRTNSTISPQEEEHTEDESEVFIDPQKLPEHLKLITMRTGGHRFPRENKLTVFPDIIECARQNTATARPEFWTRQVWETLPEPPALQIFPPDDLLWDLIEIFFTQLNIWCFILHRPTFEKSVSDGLHLRDHRFGATVLGVCALASKNSPDNRVLVPESRGELSAGWQWFRQMRQPFSRPVDPLEESASLYELQLCGLYIMFKQAGSSFNSSWLLSRIGIQHAQKMGVHRRRDGHGPLNIPHEMLKRCFHFLSLFDAFGSAYSGKPRVVIAADCDLGLPVARDDEYLELGVSHRAFKQAPGKFSLIDYHIAYIQLIGIVTFTGREENAPDYAGNIPLGADVVADLDARCNQWATEIPEHLLWNPYTEDDVLFDQSAALYAAYYHVQIIVHRTFVLTRRPPSAASAFKSLAVCTNAARSCSHVLDVKTRRGFLPNAHTLKAGFDSAIVLLLNISGGARSGLPIDVGRELVDLYKCMSFLCQSERRWKNAGRYYDVLCELLIASNLPLPPVSEPSSADPWMNNSYKSNRDLASGNQVSDLRTQNSESWPEHFFSLPMAAEDLGRLPIYGSLDSMEMDIIDKIMADLTTPGAPAAFDSSILDTGPPIANLPDLSRTPEWSNAMNMDPNLSSWTPYFSNVGEMTQMIQNRQA